MTLSRFVMKNAFRNARRTMLTVASIGFSLFLLNTLATALDSLINPPTSKDSELRIAVRRSTSLADQLPISYEREIAKVPHVKAILPLQWTGFQYKEPKNFFPNFATDPVRVFEMFPELETDEATKKAFMEERRGALIHKELAKRFDWKVGDLVNLQGAIFPVDIELKIIGLYDSTYQKNTLYFNWDYLNEALEKPNKIGTYWVMADSAENIPGIIDAIDSQFRNSPAETKSETEKAFMLAFTSMLGNVRVLIGSVGLVILFTMLLVTGSTMAMTIRERFREVGILKALGYPGRLVLGLMLGEAVFVALLGTLLAFAFSALLATQNLAELGLVFLEDVRPSAATLAISAGVGVGIAVVSAFIPARQAASLTITQAMRRLD